MRLAYWRPVDGSIDGQLLYVPSLQIPPRLVDVIFATTTNGSVFAYDANDDADSGTGRGRLWQTSLLGRDEPQTPGTPYGVLSTPVIDLVAKMLFVVSRTKGDPIDEFWLLALDIVSGKILRKTQIESPGFSAAFQNQRPALLLDHDMVYIGFGQWGGEGDHEYHGWVLRYDAHTLTLKGSFNSTPGFSCVIGADRRCCDKPPCKLPGGGAGIWQGGGGLAADGDGNIYLMTGNGKYDPGKSEFGDSFIKLGTRGDNWGLIQHFAPAEAQHLYLCDLDLSAGGPLLIPESDRLVGGGKTGTLYALKRSDLQSAPQSLSGGTDTYHLTNNVCWWEGGPHLHGSPGYWQSLNGNYVYIWAEQDYLRRFTVRSDGTLDPTPARGDVTGPKCVDSHAHGGESGPPGDRMCPMPGGMLSISADGKASGIVWATLPVNTGKTYYTIPGLPPPGQLIAYNAEKMVLLWREELPSLLGKWTPPTIADGKVFVASSGGDAQTGRVLVYELGPIPTRPPNVEASLLIDNRSSLDVAWLDLGEGVGWHPPQPISDPVAPPGASVAMAKQTDTVLTALLVDRSGRLNVAWLDLADRQGWHKPQPISDVVAPPGASVVMAKQTDTVLTALFVGNDGRLNVAWLDLADHQGWHKPQPISDAVAPPGASVAMAKQTDTVLTALFVGNGGRLNVAWLDLADRQGWHKPQPISDVVATPGTSVAMGKQSDQVLTALLIDKLGRLNVAWLDLSEGLGWHPPKAISDPVAPSRATVSIERQSP
jgi:outer membrane protein assembly factor BamB